jgi:hypothetical protein
VKSANRRPSSSYTVKSALEGWKFIDTALYKVHMLLVGKLNV